MHIHLMIWFAAAASLLTAPEAKSGWFAPDDLPMDIVTGDKPMFVGIRVTITPSGQLQTCEVETSSGSKKLDEHTCEITRRRARFEPARWIDGSPAWGVFRMPVGYVLVSDRTRIRREIGDLVLRLNKLPEKVRSPAEVVVALAVKRNGEIAACAAAEDKPNAQLTAIACRQLSLSFRTIPAKDGHGQLVDSVQVGRVAFVAE